MFRERIENALWGAFVGDAIGMPSHWYYTDDELRGDFPNGIRGYQAAPGESDRRSLPHPFARACYPEHGIPLILWMARIHGGDLYESLCTNAMIGGDTVHRGMILGVLLGTIQPVDESFRKGLVHNEALEADISGFVNMALSGRGHLTV